MMPYDMMYDGNLAFRWAAMHGHLHTCRWLKKVCKMNKEDMMIKDNEAFQLAALYGRLHICKWLADICNMNKDDVMAADNYAFRYANDYNIRDWLSEKFGITEDS